MKLPRDLGAFAGRWHLTRRIEKLGAGNGRPYPGVAVFSPDADGLRCREAGEIRLPGGIGGETLWRAVGDGVDVCFADGMDYHHFSLSYPVVTAFYESGSMRHELSYNFSHWPRWRAIWRVRESGGDAASGYTVVSDYRR